jgi:hypothetical protein
VRALKTTAVLGAAVFLLALLAAWQLPPRLDWNRYRGAIAAFASARMGRQVSIGGQVRLQLLPEAVLVADRVTLADRGDGVSATIGALRLRISIAAILQGRVLPRRLELDDPVVTLPWPLPREAANAVPRGLAGGFTASVEGGSLRLGGVVLGGISAAVLTDPDTGAFAAQGAARLGGLPGRFTALVGAPGPDGVSLLTVTVDGQGRAQGTGGTLRGRILAGGSVSGDLALRGPDLSRLLAGPAVSWQAKGPVTATGTDMRGDKLAVMLGDSPGDASAVLRLGVAPQLEVAVHVGQVQLDGWGLGPLAATPAIPISLNFSATAAGLMDGTIRDGHVVLALGQGAAHLNASGILPGGGTVKLDGTGRAGRDGEIFTGRFALPAPDLPRLVTWLRPVAPAVIDALPALPVSGDISGAITASRGRAELTGLSGHVAGGAFSGSLGLFTGSRPRIAASLALDRLSLTMPASPDSGGSGWWAALQAWPGILAGPFGGFDASLDISAATASLGGFTVSRLDLQGQGGADGFLCRRLAADLPGAHMELSGNFGRDGSLGDVRLDLAAADAAALRIPVRVPAGLWQGPLHVAVTAAGPKQAVVGQLRGDLGDLRAEAELGLDMTAPLVTATLTLRHPGAPRLLELAGLPGAGAWIGQGSVAFLAHVNASPGQLVVSDFSLGAGALRMNGAVHADLSGAEPALTGGLDAPVLTLPSRFDAANGGLPLALLHGWHGQFTLKARQMLAGLTPLAGNAAATLTVANDNALVESISLDAAGGHVTGTAAVDAAVKLPVFSLLGEADTTDLDAWPVLPGLVLTGGKLTVAADVSASGHTAAALLATAHGTVHGTVSASSLQNVDLPALTRLLTARGPRLRTALAASLASGQSGPLSGNFDAAIENGTWTFGGATLSGPSGSIAVSGSIDVPARSPDLLLRAMPAVPKPPVLPVRVLAGRRIANPQPGMAWAGRR